MGNKIIPLCFFKEASHISCLIGAFVFQGILPGCIDFLLTGYGINSVGAVVFLIINIKIAPGIVTAPAVAVHTVKKGKISLHSRTEILGPQIAVLSLIVY